MHLVIRRGCWNCADFPHFIAMHTSAHFVFHCSLMIVYELQCVCVWSLQMFTWPQYTLEMWIITLKPYTNTRTHARNHFWPFYEHRKSNRSWKFLRDVRVWTGTVRKRSEFIEESSANLCLIIMCLFVCLFFYAKIIIIKIKHNVKNCKCCLQEYWSVNH